METPTVKTNIEKDTEGEYTVKLFVGGVHQEAADYFTDDEQDADETAFAMEQQARAKLEPDVYREYSLKEKLINVLAAETSILDPEDAAALAKVIFAEMPELLKAAQVSE